MTTLLASLEIERDLPVLSQFPVYLAAWLRDAGIIAAIGVLIWTISYLVKTRSERWLKLSPVGAVFALSLGVSLICYAVFLFFLGTQDLVPQEITENNKTVVIFNFNWLQNLFLTLGGAFAIVAAVTPMAANLAVNLSLRRIIALSRLSIKEAVRGRVIWVFCIMGVLFLFYGFFMPTNKLENQIRDYITAIYTPMSILFLVTAAFLGAFSIPLDVTRQTIHTIVTKPVQKYEIVLGRFFGYGALLTVILVVLTLLSLTYVIRGVNPEAARESYKARQPIFADELVFHGTLSSKKGESVGREWTYRSYIRGRTPGTNEPRQFAEWAFASLPTELADRRDSIPVEFTFDIYRTTKGTENLGVLCTLYFADGRLDVGQIQNKAAEFDRAFNAALAAIDDKYRSEWQGASRDRKAQIEKAKQQEANQIQQALIEKNGVFTLAGVEIQDYHTLSKEIPAALFKHIRTAQTAGAEADPPVPNPALKVMVAINDDPSSRHQLLGMAKRDLYLLPAELPFWQNYIKGMIGLWCNTLLVLGIAVACSTYLNGVISFLCSLFFLGLGSVAEFIRNLAQGTSWEGGAFESAYRIFHRLPGGGEMEKTTAAAVGSAMDVFFRSYLNLFLRYIPDIHRFDLTEFVREGFDIPWVSVLFMDNLLLLAAFLIPWGVLAYYLMNYREIANPR